MTTGQTMLTVAAFTLLSTVLVNFYPLLSATGDDIASGQDGILATSSRIVKVAFITRLDVDNSVATFTMYVTRNTPLARRIALIVQDITIAVCHRSTIGGQTVRNADCFSGAPGFRLFITTHQ